MDRKTILKKLGILLLAALAAAAVWLLCRWVAYDLQERVGDQYQYEIVNDEYSQVVEIPEEGLYQTLPAKAGEEIYGVRLKFSTYGTLYRAGMVMADLYNEEGRLVGQMAGSYESIFDDTFTTLPMGSFYRPETDETLTLHLYNVVPWEGPLGLWASEGAVDGMPLYTGTPDTHADATAAVQYIVDDSGSWPSQLLLEISTPLALAAGLAIVLLFALRAPLAVVVAVVGLLLGTSFATVTPLLVAPDEYTHLAASYELASRWSGQQLADETGKLLVRACDAPYFTTRSGEIGIFAYKETLYNRIMGGNEPDLTVVSEADAGQGTGSYLAQAAGLWYGRQKNASFQQMMLYGRYANLAAYLVLVVLALCTAPAALRGLLAVVALLPMPLQLAASLSPDATVLGTVFWFTALCFRLRAAPAKRWQLVLLAVLALVVAPSKAIYLPVVALCLLIPAAHLDPRRSPAVSTVALGRCRVAPGRLVQLGVLVLALAAWAGYNATALRYAARDMNFALLAAAAVAGVAVLAVLGAVYAKIRQSPTRRRWFWRGVAVAAVAAVPLAMFVLAHMGGGLTPEQLVEGIQPNGDSIYTFSFGYICRNLPATAKMLLRTIPEQGALWLQGLLGTTLGEPIVYRIDVSWLLGVGLLVALLAAALPVQGQPHTLGCRSRAGLAAVVLLVVGISFVVALGWTPINYTTLFGLQGRYWLPVLPLALVLCKTGKSIAIQRDMTRPALLVIILFNVLVQLQGAGLYATWQAVQ